MSPRRPRRPGAVIAAAAVLLASAALAQPSKPRAVFKETSHDFGKVKQGDVVTHEFVFTNEGGSTLVVEKVETTCGCTAALVSEKKIAPGKEGRIKTTFDTRGYSGRLSRYIYLVSNDGEDPRRELSPRRRHRGPALGPHRRRPLQRRHGPRPRRASRPRPRSSSRAPASASSRSRWPTRTSSSSPAASPWPRRSSCPGANRARSSSASRPSRRPASCRDYVLIKSNDPVRSTLSIYVSRYVISKKELKDLFERYKSILKDKD